MILYHFTSTHHLEIIEAAGELLLTDTMLDPNVKRSYTENPPALWTLDVPQLGGHSHGIDVPNWPVDKTAVRFTIDVPDKWVLQWVNWADAQGIDHRWKQMVMNIGGGPEAAKHWYCVFRKVPRVHWVDIKMMHEEVAS